MQSKQQTLNQCHEGQECRITSLAGDLEMKLHLVNLGFHQRCQVKVLQRRDNGLVVNADGSRFAVDNEIAANINVAEI